MIVEDVWDLLQFFSGEDLASRVVRGIQHHELGLVVDRCLKLGGIEYPASILHLEGHTSNLSSADISVDKVLSKQWLEDDNLISIIEQGLEQEAD